MKRILVVDDSLSMREFLALLLLSKFKDIGIEVTMASDGWTAFDAISKSECKFDLVLTDNDMPGMFGSELVVAAHDSGCTTPFIMVTGDEKDQIPPVARRLLKEVVSKPFDIDSFCVLIRKTLQ